MKPLRTLLLITAGLSLAASVDARRKEAQGETSRGLTPEIQDVLGGSYQMLPELADRIQPGVIYQLSPEGLTVLTSGCVQAPPRSSHLTLPSMQSSLAGGVSVSAGLIGGSVEAAYSLKISFLEPQILGYEALDFTPSLDCQQRLARYAETHSLADSFLVREVLMARISGCEEIRGEAELRLPRGSGSLAGTQACTLMSSVPVAVGVRQEPLSAVPELAHLVPSPGIPVSPGPVTPAPPVEPVPAPPAAGARELLPPIPTGIPMIALPAGQFEMGCPSGARQELSPADAACPPSDHHAELRPGRDRGHPGPVRGRDGERGGHP